MVYKYKGIFATFFYFLSALLFVFCNYLSTELGSALGLAGAFVALYGFIFCAYNYYWGNDRRY